MKKITIIIALMLFPLSSFAQLEIDYNYLNQQQKEIGSTIEADIKAQMREKMKQQQALEQQNQPQMFQNQTQSRQQQSQTTQQQALQNFNNRISIEGQQRMEYYNNPDNYINRSITNRRPTINNTSPQNNSFLENNTNRYNSQNQYNDLRTRPIHSEELTSKSLQMLRDANREFFSNEDRAEKANADVYVQLFEHPKISERPFVEKPNLMQWAWNEQARRMKLQNEVDNTNAMIDMTKRGLGIVGGIVTKGALSASALVSANLNLYAELVKYANECSSGVRQSEGINDTFEILGNTIINTAVDFVAPWVGDEVGAAYLGLEYAGTQSWGMLNSVQIGFTLSDFAVNNEKHEE